MNRRQLTVLFVLLVINTLSAFLSYAVFGDQLAAATGMSMPDMRVSNLAMGLANGGIVFVLYGILGLAGIWFAHKLDLPGIYHQDGNWRRWVLTPLILGVVCGLLLIIGDRIFAPINGFGHLPHPVFPLSLLASLSAGIGEEIAFRGFVFGLWGVILSWALHRFNVREAALWTANIVAAMIFGAGHLGTVMVFANAASLSDLSTALLAEIFLLNGIVGLIASDQYIKTGLIAAVGVHFWADVVWHVLWGLFA